MSPPAPALFTLRHSWALRQFGPTPDHLRLFFWHLNTPDAPALDGRQRRWGWRATETPSRDNLGAAGRARAEAAMKDSDSALQSVGSWIEMQPIALCLDRVIKKILRQCVMDAKVQHWMSALCPPSEKRETRLGPEGDRPCGVGNRSEQTARPWQGREGLDPHAKSVLPTLSCCDTQSEWWYLFAHWRKKGGTAFCWRLLAPEQSWAAPGLWSSLCAGGGISIRYKAVRGWWYQYPGGNFHGLLCSTAGSTEDAVVLPGWPDGKLSREDYWPPAPMGSYGCCLSLWVKNPANLIMPSPLIQNG